MVLILLILHCFVIRRCMLDFVCDFGFCCCVLVCVFGYWWCCLFWVLFAGCGFYLYCGFIWFVCGVCLFGFCFVWCLAVVFWCLVFCYLACIAWCLLGCVVVGLASIVTDLLIVLIFCFVYIFWLLY